VETPPQHDPEAAAGASGPRRRRARGRTALPGPRDPGTRDEVALVKAITDARTLVGDALETARWRLEESDRG
jgi:hypothetical protein